MFAKVNPKHDPRQQHHHRGDRGQHPRGLHSAGQARRHGVDRHPHRVHRRVARRDHPSGREPDLPRGFKVPLSRDAHPVGIACGYILYSLHWYTWIAFGAWVVVVVLFYLIWGRHHSALNRRWRRRHRLGRAGCRRRRNRDAEGRPVTVIVGYLPARPASRRLNLGVEAARTLKTSLAVVTVVPEPWTTPSPATVDAEFAQYADRLAVDSAARGEGVHRNAGPRPRGHLSQLRAPIGPRRVAGCGGGTESRGAGAGFGLGRQPGSGGVGSTADRLLHSSPVPLAICPRGYRGSKSHD